MFQAFDDNDPNPLAPPSAVRRQYGTHICWLSLNRKPPSIGRMHGCEDVPKLAKAARAGAGEAGNGAGDVNNGGGNGAGAGVVLAIRSPII